MNRIPAARYVKMKLELTKGVGAMAVMARMQEHLEMQAELHNTGEFTFLRLTALGELGWLAEIVWDHHDGEIVEHKEISKHPWNAIYNVCAAHFRNEERLAATDLGQAEVIHIIKPRVVLDYAKH